MIKDSLDQLGGAVRWVPHELNPVDCFTKLKGNAAPLIQLLRRGKFKLTAETEELARRKEYRETTGMRNPRPNQSVSNSWFCSREVKVTFTSAPVENQDVVGPSEGQDSVGLQVEGQDLKSMIGFNCSVDLYAIDGPLEISCPPAQTLCCLCENTLSFCTCTAMSSSSVPKYGHRQMPIPNKGKGAKDKQKDKRKGTPAVAGEKGPLPEKGSRKGRPETRSGDAAEGSKTRSDSARPQKHVF